MRHVPGLALAALAAIALIACGETQEVTQSESPGATTPAASGSATPTPSPGATATASPTAAADPAAPTSPPVNEDGTVVPPPSRDDTPAVPSDWVSSSVRGLQFEHPEDWYLSADNTKLYSFDPATTKGQESIPFGEVAIDFGWAPPDASSVTKPTNASDATIAGTIGWELVKVYGPSLRTHSVVLPKDDAAYFFLASFGDPHDDETVFSQVLSSITFVN